MVCLAARCDHGGITDRDKRLLVSNECVHLAVEQATKRRQLDVVLLESSVREEERHADGAFYVTDPKAHGERARFLVPCPSIDEATRIRPVCA